MSVELQVVDGIAKASNTVKIRVGGETWEWTSYYDPVVALNPTFYQCAKIIAKLPGKRISVLLCPKSCLYSPITVIRSAT